MTETQEENLGELLMSQGITEAAEIKYCTALITTLQNKLIPLVGGEFSELVRIAKKGDGAKVEGKFSLAVKFDITSWDVLKSDYAMSYSESHKASEGELLDLTTQVLPFEEDPLETYSEDEEEPEEEERDEAGNVVQAGGEVVL